MHQGQERLSGACGSG